MIYWGKKKKAVMTLLMKNKLKKKSSVMWKFLHVRTHPPGHWIGDNCKFINPLCFVAGLFNVVTLILSLPKIFLSGCKIIVFEEKKKSLRGILGVSVNTV